MRVGLGHVGSTLPFVNSRRESVWCGRRGSNPHDLTIERFSYPLRLSPPARDRAVCGLDYPFTIVGCPTLGAARLVSTPSGSNRFNPAWLGIGVGRFVGPLAFPEFEQFYS